MTGADATFSARRSALAAAARWRLPFARQTWRGPAGNWAGVGAGSSLDFQDHRNYVPGDDPRHIHWQAFARTGALTMKLYRAEVAPFVDIVVDVSRSMALTPAKEARTDELLAFCVECADRAGAPVRVHAAAGRALRAVSPEEVRAGRWRERLGVAADPSASSGQAARRPADAPGDSPASSPRPPPFASETAPPGPLPWRVGAMKVLICDLLFAAEPSAVLVPLAAGAGVGVVLAPALAEEAELPWRGNVELTDCEHDAVRRQRIDEPLAARYAAAYTRHFALWREAARKRGVLFARVPCEVALATALAGEALAAGAVEAVS